MLYSIAIAKHESETGMRITLISGLVIVAFMAFGLAISVYRMAVFDNSVGSIKEQNEQIAQRITSKKQELEYYRSVQFKDKFAKEQLQLVAADEHMLIIESASNTVSKPIYKNEDHSQFIFEEHLRQMPVYQHWQLYLFEKEALEQLQESL